jgi:hypothetical protein
MQREYSLSLNNPQPTVGVLTDSEILLVDVVGDKRVLRSLLLPADAQLSGLLEYLWQAELPAIWVMPATTHSSTIRSAYLEQMRTNWNVVIHSHPTDSSRPTSVLLWPKSGHQHGTRRLVLAFPGYAGWDWEISDARSLLATLTYLDQVLGRSFFDVPKLAAHQLLTELAGDQLATWMRSYSIDPHELQGKDGSLVPLMERAKDLTWMRPLTLVEQRERYLHKYTHLSLLLEAAMSIRLGIGEPQYSANGRAYDGTRPGFWRVNAERLGSVFDGTKLPSCLDGEWMSTPQLQCCRDIGYQVQVREGYSWQESQQLLKDWATTLWRAGERLYTQYQLFRHAQARANTAHTLTQLTDLGVAIISQEQESGGWNRPDWWACLVGGSRARLFGHLVRLVRKGIMPVLLVGNSLWVVSNDPNPLTAVPELASARRWQGYTVGYSAPIPLSTDIRDAFRTMKDAAQMAEMLDTLAREVFP